MLIGLSRENFQPFPTNNPLFVDFQKMMIRATLAERRLYIMREKFRRGRARRKVLRSRFKKLLLENKKERKRLRAVGEEALNKDRMIAKLKSKFPIYATQCVR